ncbi:TPA: hypothetical protein ACGD69_003366 [Serratia marcescens]|uniref:phage tail tube protein n=1 Tax=Serratia TaxID=613 RepID=UPI0011544AD3|nr:hypothetical protein [Serratia marcescens]MBH3263643.1 hypothetical protein [Serratia marcescens]QDI15295.1 hypothetical protein FBF84_19955 [Serratia marcescens]QDI25036.1 hypothetical protein FBF90_19945 [Serratia marcescens]HEM7575942.1 hypothetical protein [Serratia marcescens]
MNETYYYGQGKVYLARRDESGHPGAWRWVGDVSALEITLSSEYKVKKISRAGKLVSVQNFMFSHSGKLLSTWHSFSPENLAILLSSVCVKNTPAIVANESLPAGIQAGDRVSLAHQNVWDVDISGLKAGVEFVVDAVWGAIEFIRTPGNQPLNASYCYANSVSIPIFTSAKNEFAFRYEGQNLAEDKRKTLVELYRVAFEPVTSFPLINNDSSIAKLETSAEVMYDINRAADSKLGQFGKVVLIEELNGITHDGSIYHNGIYTHGGK